MILEKYYFRFLDDHKRRDEIPRFIQVPRYELTTIDAINSDCRWEVERENMLHYTFFSPFPDETCEGRQAVRRCCTRWKMEARQVTRLDPKGKRERVGAKLARGRRVWLTPSRLRGFGRHRVKGWEEGSTLCRPTAALFPVAINCLARPALPSFLPSFSPPSPADAPIAGSSIFLTASSLDRSALVQQRNASLPSTPELSSTALAWPSLFAPRNT